MTKKNCGKRVDLDVLKPHLVDMMAALADFCEENGIRYYLSGGTLLGAVRHKGFIPWDDDIDVNVPRPDCEKLQKLSCGRIGKYELIAPSGTGDYPANHWKLYDKSIIIENSYKGSSKQFVYHPIFIDIFPIEGLPADEKANQKHYNKMLFPKKMINCMNGPLIHGKTLPSKIFHLVFRPLASAFGMQHWADQIQKIAKSVPFDEADYIGVMMTNVHTTEERVKKATYIPQIEVDFEGRRFKAPEDYHTYLSQLYGDDYMQLPPPEKRVSHHGFTLYQYKEKERS